MQKVLFILSFLCCIMGMQQSASAQCAYDNTQFGSYAAPTTVGVDVELSICFYGGEYAHVTGLVSGNTYRFSTCGNTAFDTQITVYEAGPGAILGYNDDGCGAQSTIDFVYSGGIGNVDVLIDQYPCASNTTCIPLTVQLVAVSPPPAGGCDTYGYYCYDNNVAVEFATTTPTTNSQAVSITLEGSVENSFDYLYILENGAVIAALTGILGGTYTGAPGATMSLYLISDGSFSFDLGYFVGFSTTCVTPPPTLIL